MVDFQKQVTALVDKTVSAGKSDDAVRYAQAALNAAHAAQVLTIVKENKLPKMTPTEWIAFKKQNPSILE